MKKKAGIAIAFCIICSCAEARITTASLKCRAAVLDNLKIRSAQSLRADKTGLLRKNDTVVIEKIGIQQTVDGITDRWCYIRTQNGDYGWCFGGYLKAEVLSRAFISDGNIFNATETDTAEASVCKISRKDIWYKESSSLVSSDGTLCAVRYNSIIDICRMEDNSVLQEIDISKFTDSDCSSDRDDEGCCAFSPDSSKFYFPAHGFVREYTISTGAVEKLCPVTLHDTYEYTDSMVCSKDGNYLVWSVSTQGYPYVWQLLVYDFSKKTLSGIAEKPPYKDSTYECPFSSAGFSPDGKKLICLSASEKLTILSYDPEKKGTGPAEFGIQDYGKCIVLPDGNVAVAGDVLSVMDGTKGKIKNKYFFYPDAANGFSSEANCTAVSDDGKILAVSLYYSPCVFFYSLSTFNLLYVLETDITDIGSLRFKNGILSVTGSNPPLDNPFEGLRYQNERYLLILNEKNSNPFQPVRRSVQERALLSWPLEIETNGDYAEPVLYFSPDGYYYASDNDPESGDSCAHVYGAYEITTNNSSYYVKLYPAVEENGMYPERILDDNVYFKSIEISRGQEGLVFRIRMEGKDPAEGCTLSPAGTSYYDVNLTSAKFVDCSLPLPDYDVEDYGRYGERLSTWEY